MVGERVILVIGGGRGIGEAIAHRFHAAGDQIVIADIDHGSAERVAGQVDGRGWPIDVSDEASISRLFGLLMAEFGRLDVVVNTAGLFRFGTPFYEMPIDEWRDVVDVNLTGTFLCTRAAAQCILPHSGGSIINFASGSGTRANQSTAAYGASKAGVAHFTRIAAIDLAHRGIRVNAVSPGVTLTPMVEAAHESARQADLARGVPLGSLMNPDDIAGAALFLASSEARFVTGEVLNVDGGTSIAGRFMTPVGD